MKFFRFLIYSLAVLFFVGCTNMAQPTPDMTKPTDFNRGYPVRKSTDLASSFVTPTKETSKSLITGRLLLKDKAVTEGIIYLSEVIKNQNGKDIVVSMDRESSLRGKLDENGNFSIYNVPEGHYGVVYDLISDAYLLMDPNISDQSFVIDVEADKDLNLGNLSYDSLPSRN